MSTLEAPSLFIIPALLTPSPSMGVTSNEFPLLNKAGLYVKATAGNGEFCLSMPLVSIPSALSCRLTDINYQL